MNRKLFMALVGLAAVASIPAACKDDETNTTTTSTTTTTTTTTTASGGTGGTGGAIGGGGSGGGACPCFTCGAYVTDCLDGTCPDNSEICGYQAAGGSGGTTTSPSQEALLAMQTCVCTACIADCQLTCTGTGADTANCFACRAGALGTTCATEYGECQADTCAP